VKSGDIERVRRDVDQCEARVAHDKKIAATHKAQVLLLKYTSEVDAEA
jgi:hypothetical protein